LEAPALLDRASPHLERPTLGDATGARLPLRPARSREDEDKLNGAVSRRSGDKH
jgi:hypothetical protein